MKQFLVIPLGGLGKRFEDQGYKTYKPFLEISKKSRIIDNIINNFPKSNTHLIIIGNEKKFKNITLNYKRKNTSFIKINNHKSGPMYSLFLAREKLKEIIKENNFFVSYSDINWKWNYKKIKDYISDKKIVIFSHKGFHPHLETDSKSDFFTCKKNGKVKKVSEKKKINKDYKKNYLAIGCYYFENLKYFEKLFNSKNFRDTTKKKEVYIINLLSLCLKNKIQINYYNLTKFVHLGIPEQYEDFIRWRNTLIENFNKSMNLNFSSIMLMAGKGKRVKILKEKKPFLLIKNSKIFEYIFYKYGSKDKSIITNNDYFKAINRPYSKFKIYKSNSMIETVYKSHDLFKNKKNFFLLSCDCFGDFQRGKLERFIKQNNPDVILFAFSITKLQKTLSNSHTTIELKNNSIKSINVKKYIKNKNEFGHAGFFWIKNENILKDLKNFSFKSKLKREVLLDDYFKFLFDKKICKVKCFKVDNYVHIGSIKEYQELKYWENYFYDEDTQYN